MLLPDEKRERLEADWPGAFRRAALPLINEELFRDLCCDNNGRPNKPVQTIIGMLLLKEMHDLVDRFRGSDSVEAMETYALLLRLLAKQCELTESPVASAEGDADIDQIPASVTVQPLMWREAEGMERAANPPLVVSFLLRGEAALECESEAVAFALSLFIQRGQATEEKRQLRYRTPKPARGGRESQGGLNGYQFRNETLQRRGIRYNWVRQLVVGISLWLRPSPSVHWRYGKKTGRRHAEAQSPKRKYR